MPELPEVQTTVDGIKAKAKGLQILDVWTDYRSDFHIGKDNIANPKFFSHFKKSVRKSKIINASRRAKNVLIHLSNGKTILIHMKMTGHVMYGKYKKEKNKWIALGSGPLRDDPFNRHVHLVFTLSNGKHLVLCDMRKFAKVTLVDTDTLAESEHLKHHGPEPLEDTFVFEEFKSRLLTKPHWPVKKVLMDLTVVSGIGNIYSDEILWSAGVHPIELIENIKNPKLLLVFEAMKNILRRGIDFGGDSMSDYRNIDGLAGKFQNRHNAYQKTGEKCNKNNCGGIIERIVVGGRSAHFCNKHQKLTK